MFVFYPVEKPLSRNEVDVKKQPFTFHISRTPITGNGYSIKRWRYHRKFDSTMLGISEVMTNPSLAANATQRIIKSRISCGSYSAIFQTDSGEFIIFVVVMCKSSKAFANLMRIEFKCFSTLREGSAASDASVTAPYYRFRTVLRDKDKFAFCQNVIPKSLFFAFSRLIFICLIL